MIKSTLAAIALSCALVGNAGAHDTFLWPSSFAPRVDEEITLSLSSTARFPAQETPIAKARIDIMQAPANASRWSPEIAREAARALELPVSFHEPGLYLLNVALAPRDIEIEADEAAHYFHEIGAPRTTRAAYEALPEPRLMRETYTKYISVFICVAPCATTEYTQLSIGADLEFVPIEMNAAPLRRFRLMARANPVPGLQVTVTTMQSARFLVTTEPDGAFSLPPDVRGPVLLSAAILRPPVSDAARWTSDFATLSFLAP
ncbi:MAG: DUF4198 domain-containing protein [Hyphomonadaceae bacterium]